MISRANNTEIFEDNPNGRGVLTVDIQSDAIDDGFETLNNGHATQGHLIVWTRGQEIVQGSFNCEDQSLEAASSKNLK